MLKSSSVLLPLWRALVHKRTNTFYGIAAQKALRHNSAGMVIGGGKAHFRLGIEGFLALRDGPARYNASAISS